MSVNKFSNFLRINSFVVLVLMFQKAVYLSELEAVCGTVTLTYFLTGNSTSARLNFLSSTELSSYRWVHFFSEKKPDFKFLHASKIGGLKYEKEGPVLIIKNLQASDEGFYNVQCDEVSGRHTFSKNKVKIERPYVLETTWTPSTENIRSTLVEPNVTSATMKTEHSATSPTTEEDLKTTTDATPITRDVYLQTDPVQVTETDVRVTPKHENVTMERNVTKGYTTDGDLTTDNANTISEQASGYFREQAEVDPSIGVRFDSTTEGSKPTGIQKGLDFETLLLIIGCIVGGNLVIIVVVVIVVRKKSRSSSEAGNEDKQDKGAKFRTSSYLTAVAEKIDGNYCYSVADETEREPPFNELQTFSIQKPVTNETYGLAALNTEAKPQEAGNDHGYCEIKKLATDQFKPCKGEIVPEDLGNKYEIVSEERPNECFNFATQVSVLTGVQEMNIGVAPANGKKDNFLSGENVLDRGEDYENVLPGSRGKEQPRVYVNVALDIQTK